MTLFALLFIFGFNWSHAHTDCEPFLDGGHRLSIGVLGKDWDGNWRLLLGSYVSSSHQQLVLHMVSDLNIKSLHWFGEIEYFRRRSGIQIVRANDTSGYYHRYGHRIPLQHENEVEEIPSVWRAKEFQPIRFTDGGEAHLAHVLNYGLGENRRHEFANDLAMFGAVLKAVSSNRFSVDRRLAAHREFMAAKYTRIRLAWLFRVLASEDTVSTENSQETLNFLTRPGFTLISAARLPVDSVRQEILNIADRLRREDLGEQMELFSANED